LNFAPFSAGTSEADDCPPLGGLSRDELVEQAE